MRTKTKTLQIHDWMLSLGLTEKQERVYALIYGYSQDGMSRMRGTAASIAEWLHCTQRNAQYILRQLEDKGLIAHEVVVVPRSPRHPGGVLTEFWAVDPDEATAPDKGKKGRIPWKGSRRGLRNETDFVTHYETDFVTPHKDSNSNHTLSSCGGKNKRAHARNSTTTTGFLFENDESGLAPGLDLAQLSLPYEQTWFVDAVKLLLQQPAWKSKSAAAVQIVLDDLGALNDDMAATYICRLAVRREWDDISNARKIADDDADKISAYAGEVYAHQEGAIA